MNSTKTVAIVTGHGGHLGTGHIQRAVSLAWYLNSLPEVESFIMAPEPSGVFHDEVHQYFSSPAQVSPDLIIRDMRDSSVEEMQKLQRIAKVLTVDDIGEGRGAADWCVDLLPNPVLGSSNDFMFQKRHFVFGYNFLSSIMDQRERSIIKTIDVLLYCGNDPDQRYLEKITGLLPGNIVCAVAAGEKSFIIKNGMSHHVENCTYGELLLGSKVVVTHFGILVYEALLSGAGVITINPTGYHSTIADCIADESGIRNLGTRDSFDETLFRDILDEMLHSDSIASVSPGVMYANAMGNLERFAHYVLNLIA